VIEPTHALCVWCGSPWCTCYDTDEEYDMSIDARVDVVHINEDGSGELRLVDRPPSRPGQNPGIAGQRSLSYLTAPEEVTALNGLDVWGGSDELMLGDRKIADRVGYTRIVFVSWADFNAAVAEYHRKHHREPPKPAVGTCAKCGRAMYHARLKGYRCTVCD
jgi:hypothetical protein